MTIQYALNILKTYPFVDIDKEGDTIRKHVKSEDVTAELLNSYLSAHKKIELVPKIGTAKVMLGTIDNYEKKMEKLSAFYKAYPEYAFGDKYETINLEYNKLIYGTLKKTTAL